MNVNVRSVPKSVVSPSRFRLILRWDNPMSNENTVTRTKVTSCWGRYSYNFSITLSECLFELSFFEDPL